MSGRFGVLNSIRGVRLERGPNVRETSCIDEGRCTELAKVLALDADPDENIDIAGDGLGCMLVVLPCGVSVIGNPKSLRTFKAFVKSTGL